MSDSTALNPEQLAKVEAETRDEIDEIMSEIQDLRSQPEPEAQGIAPEMSHDLMEGAGGGGASLEETLGNLKGEETDAPSLLDVPNSAEENVMAKPAESRTSADSEPGTLSMVLTGNMTLKLKYEYEGQEITVGFADQALHVALADGTEFKIPLAARKLRSVA